MIGANINIYASSGNCKQVNVIFRQERWIVGVKWGKLYIINPNQAPVRVWCRRTQIHGPKDWNSGSKKCDGHSHGKCIKGKV